MKKTEPPRTEYQKLHDLLDQYSFILHPNLFNGIKMQVVATMRELEKKANENAGISDEALLIEKMINEMRAAIKRIDHPTVISFQKKMLYKELIKIL